MLWQAPLESLGERGLRLGQARAVRAAGHMGLDLGRERVGQPAALEIEEMRMRLGAVHRRQRA